MAPAPTRISACLERLAADGRTALVPYLTIGDPDIETSRRAVLAIAQAGADVIELGVPFSDPIADGPVIQGSTQRALVSGSSLPGVLALVAALREEIDTPLVLFGYYNPFFRYGEDAFARDAAEAGADGVLVTDLPPEEALSWTDACRAAGLDRIFLLAPTSDRSRMEAVRPLGSGFVYMVSVTGVTGARKRAPEGIDSLVSEARTVTGLPVGVGFGIASAEQARAVGRYADLVIVGSALVSRMNAAGADQGPAVAGEFVAELRRALDDGDGS